MGKTDAILLITSGNTLLQGFAAYQRSWTSREARRRIKKREERRAKREAKRALH